MSSGQTRLLTLSNKNRQKVRSMSSWLWVLLEGQADPVEVDVSDILNLSRLIPRIKEAFPELSSIPPGKIQFLSSNNRTQPLRKGTLITSIHTTDTSPLVVRYPFTDCTVVIRCNLSNSWFRQDWPHSSGLWHLLRAAALARFSPLDGSDFFFMVKDPVEKEITNEFQFNRVIQKAPINDENERQISISIRVEGKKAYGEWDLRDVLQNILHKSSWTSYTNAPRLNLDEFEKVTLSDDMLKLLIDELQKNTDVFGDVTRNEMTCQEFISPFLTTAVKHLQVKEPLLALRAEDELNGSRGFGPVDYTVVLDDIVICVTEAKKMDFDKGAAQNIVQMHSAVESLSKRKREDEDLKDSEEVPVMVYGIVSNARNWLFLQWAGTENDPVLYVSNMQSCNFSDAEIMKVEAKKIATYIIAILQEQIHGLNTKRRRVLKKPRLSL
ncbi:198_t:CDS:1 [Ambispora leptoticha]|uniref:198_t:CDS:1 n=1 Tax=Ambispora leptoticha TaxID=144679 RepID=A0A9N9H4B9_9GLOM|nr:198_t:CDS:1 [Ambispora leptoticha]